MDSIVREFSEATLVSAIKGNLYAFFRSLGHSSLAEFYQGQGWIRWHTSVPHPWFSGLLSIQPSTEHVEQAIYESLPYFQAHRVGVFTWWLEPGLRTEDWSRILLPHGFRYDANTPGMAVDLAVLTDSVPQPANLHIQIVEDLETLELWTQTFIRGYGLPEAFTTILFELFTGLGIDLPNCHYLSYQNGRPVAVSTLFLGAGVAGIYNVATLPEARGQGLGSALTLLPLQQARQMGYRIGVLQSSEMGFNVYRRLGFQKMCSMDHFFWEGIRDQAEN